MRQIPMILLSIGFFVILCLGYWLIVMKAAPGFLLKKKIPQRKPTMFDVRRLLQEGNREEAVKVYTQIFKVSQKKARKDIQELERNLNV